MLTPRTEIGPGLGASAAFADPVGNEFGLYARQAELIQAQIRLLSDLSDESWKLLFGAFKVSYAFAWEDDASQASASAAYTPLSWELFATLRATISKSKRLGAGTIAGGVSASADPA